MNRGWDWEMGVIEAIGDEQGRKSMLMETDYFKVVDECKQDKEYGEE